MLSLDRVKTITIYSTKQINHLYHDFRKKQNLAYETQSNQDFIDFKIFLKMIFILLEVPNFAVQFNQIGDIAMTSNMQILFVKASTWRSPYKQQFRNLSALIANQYQKYVKTFNKKQNMKLSNEFNINSIKFFDEALNQWTTNNYQFTSLLVSSFRIFIIHQLNNKKIQFQFKETNSNSLKNQWQNIQQNLITASKQVGTLKHQQICISISYWLCSIQKLFIKQCLKGGMINFLLKALSKKQISQWYGRKIINFLKLLILQASNGSIPVSQFQNNLSKFSQMHDKPQILSLINDLMQIVQSKDSQSQKKDKFQKLKQLYQKYSKNKTQQTISTYLDYLRVIILYGKSQTIKKNLSKQQNIDFILQCLRQQNNLTLIKQLLTLLLTHSSSVDQSSALQIMQDSIKKIQKILGLKQKDLKSDNKKHLINICKILKQIINRKDTHNKMIQIMKKLKIDQKLIKFSDGKTFQFQRQLYQLKKLMIPINYKNTQSQKLDTKNLLQALQNQFLSNKIRKTPGFAQIQQAKLLNDIITKDPNNIKIQIVKALPRTIYDYGDQNSQVSNLILDNSQAQQLRKIKNDLNYYALDSLTKTIPLKQNQQVIQDQNILQKVIKTGIQAHDKKVLQASARYTHIYLQKYQASKKLIQSLRNLQNKLSQQGYQQQAAFLQSKINKISEPKIPVDAVMNFLDKSSKIIKTQQIDSQETIKILQVLPDLEPANLNKVVQRLNQLLKKKANQPNFLKLYLTLVYKLSQKQSQRKIIFKNLGQTLKEIYLFTKSKQSENPLFLQTSSLFYLIFSQLFSNAEQKEKSLYFEPILKQSYDTTTKQSVRFSEQCLSIIPYQPLNLDNRSQIYMKFIYNNPQFIGRQAFYIINQKNQQEDKFWLKYKNLLVNILANNGYHNLHFLQLYFEKISQNQWQKHQLQTLYDINLINYEKCVQKIHTEQHLSNQTLKTLKSLLKISKAINKNQHLDLKNKSLEQNDILVHSSQILAQDIISKPYIKNQLETVMTQILSILILSYRKYQGSKVLIEDPNKLMNLWNLLSKISNQNINDLCLQIIRIGLIKDLQHKQYSQFEKQMKIYYDFLSNIITSEGAKHLQAINRMLKAQKNNKQKTIKTQALLYFFGQGQSLQHFYKQQQQSTNNNINMSRLSKVASIKQLDGQMSDQQLLKYLKNLIHPPYIHGLNLLINYLRKVQSSQFANTLVKVFCKSKQLYQQDQIKPVKTLEQTQTIIMNSISAQHTDLVDQFYKMIGMNKIGMSICLQKKGIGVKGVSIVADRMKNYQQDLLLCARILHINARAQKQLAVLFEKKIFIIVNNTYPQWGGNSDYGQHLGNLIGTSSKYKKNQQSYNVTKNLIQNIHKYQNGPQPLASTFYALSGLVYQYKQNQTKVGVIQIVKIIMNMILKHTKTSIVVQKGANLLSNLMYKNYTLKKIYNQVQVPEKILEVLKGYLLQQKYPYDAVKQILKLIGNIALDFQNAYKLAHLKFMAITKMLIQKSQQNQHQDIIKYNTDILYNMVKQPQSQVKAITLKFYQEGYIPCIFGTIQSYLLNSQIIQSCLDSFDYVCQLDVINDKSIDNNIFGLMGDIQKTQQWNQEIFDKWIRILYKITIYQPQTIKMLESGVLFNAADFIKARQNMKNISIQLCFGVVNKIEKLKFKFNYIKSGYIDFIIQLLGTKNLNSSDISKIIDIINQMHIKKMLNTQLYVKIFEALLDRLQIEYKDENAKNIISFLKKIKQKIVINTRSAAKLLQFSYYSLTQSQIITSPKYHKRIRQFISLLAYFNSFNMQLRILFRQQGFLSILRNWIKIDSLIQQQSSITQTCRMCLISILNDQRFLVHITQNVNIQQSQANLVKGYNSLLYRKDKSNKNAITKYDPKKNIIYSFKAPKGQIKQKYTLPLHSIITLKHSYYQDDQITKQSLFDGAGGIFSKNPILQNCVTFYGLVGQQLSIRQFNLQFQRQQQKNNFVQDLKIIISAQFRKKDYS